MNLLLTLMLVLLLLIIWFVLLDLLDFNWNEQLTGRAYRDKWAPEIESGQMPSSFRQHVIDQLYRHRFGWFLLLPTSLVGLFMLWVAPSVLDVIRVDSSSSAGGTLIVAVISLPILAFVWFIRAYERDRELTREEAELWSSEFNRLMQAASDNDSKKKILSLTAIRQLQDYLSGAKWKTNQRSNSSAIFSLFSSIVSNVSAHMPALPSNLATDAERDEYAKFIANKKSEPLLATISAVLAAVYGKRIDRRCSVCVSQDNLANMHFDFLTIPEVDFSGLNMRATTFCESDLIGANLSDMNLIDAFFVGARLRSANLSGSFLVGADFRSASLAKAKLAHADLNFADFEDAHLFGADLSGADLSEANLENANLNAVNLCGADLSGTEIYKEVALKKYKGIKFDDNTAWDMPKSDKIPNAPDNT